MISKSVVFLRGVFFSVGLLEQSLWMHQCNYLSTSIHCVFKQVGVGTECILPSVQPGVLHVS
jgi:hypothetical protein